MALPRAASKAEADYASLTFRVGTTIPTPDETDAFVGAPADVREKKLRFVQSRNDLDFARQHPEFFESPPPADVLAAASAAYTKLINAVINHAVRLSRGQVSPPRFFDPSEMSPPLTEPAPIALNRKVSLEGPPVLVPDMTGFRSSVLIYAAHAFGAGVSIDEMKDGTFWMAEDGQGFCPMEGVTIEALVLLA